MDALPFPAHPALDEYRALARELETAVDADALHDWALRFATSLTARVDVDSCADRRLSSARVAASLELWWRRYLRNLIGRNEAMGQWGNEAMAQSFLARVHGFATWPDFAAHVEALGTAGTTVALFESAVDAIVYGDIERLRALLREHPELVRTRSTRDHRSTLLHYGSANGVEDFRQQTPPNIVSIAELLLDAGADVNAASEAYGGGSTTLGLVATSIHPEKAGVQIPLMDLLLARGASIEQPGLTGNGHGAVTGCLANGQGRAARYFAERGARLDLESAAGVGRVDVMKQFFDAHGALTNGATQEQIESGFMYAAGYGRDEAVRFLLDRGANPNLRKESGETPLHWTTFGPHVGTAALLLAAGASVAARDEHYHATPLDWALYHWVRGYDADDRQRGYALIEQLIAAGSVPDLARFDEPTQSALRQDARMMEILPSPPPRRTLGPS